MILSKEDEKELTKRGLTANDFVSIIHQFTKELKPIVLERPCVAGDGLVLLNPADCHRLLSVYSEMIKSKSVIKFVPSSGAATRMFKHLFNYSPDSTTDLTEEFILNFHRFPFIPALKAIISNAGESLDDLVDKNKWGEIFSYILENKGLAYGNVPKGLVVFHQYDQQMRTAFEEHLHESVQYAKEHLGKCRIHFTLGEHCFDDVAQFVNEKAEEFAYEEFDLSYSLQSSKSDMVALDKNNEPVRDESGQMIFRPAGHGALIHNLQHADADVIFIKNIDNVTTDSKRSDTIFYKKVLGGLLMEMKSEINELLHGLEEKNHQSLTKALHFIQHWFQPGLPLGMSIEESFNYAKLRLDRPLRICGMVKNEGEPGGGPFWVLMPDGHLSKQIIEKSQVNAEDHSQVALLEQATHFNPVDLVCSIKDRTGRNYNLQHYIDHSTGFVSEKFIGGQVIKALEVPGLWNGAMALWNTVFVEVPSSTFSPVKTVNDLLRAGHQS